MNARQIRRGQALEALFFRKQDDALIAQHERLEHKRRTREALAEVSGIRNPQVLDKLMELEVSPSIMASLSIVPLVEVAWADGKVQDEEREAILAAAKKGIGEKSIDHELLEAWLNHCPPPNSCRLGPIHLRSVRDHDRNGAERTENRTDLPRAAWRKPRRLSWADVENIRAGTGDSG